MNSWKEAFTELYNKLNGSVWGAELLEKYDNSTVLRIYCSTKEAIKQIPKTLAGYETEPLVVAKHHIVEGN